MSDEEEKLVKIVGYSNFKDKQSQAVSSLSLLAFKQCPNIHDIRTLIYYFKYLFFNASDTGGHILNGLMTLKLGVLLLLYF